MKRLLLFAGLLAACGGDPAPNPNPHPLPFDVPDGGPENDAGTVSSCTARCEGDEAVSCEQSGMVSRTVRTRCTAGCESAACVRGWERCEPHFERTAGEGCEKVCDGLLAFTFDSREYCTPRCGPN